MCGTSEDGSLQKEDCALERSEDDANYIPAPFPEEIFEPVEWMQMLANIDVCVNETTPTKFVDEEGHDIVPFFMVKSIKQDTSSIFKTDTIEVKAFRIREEISIRDLSSPSEDVEAFYDAEPEVEADFSI